MQSEYPDGSTILVDPDAEPKEGDPVIVDVDGSCLLRLYQLDGGRVVLTALGNYPAITMSDEMKIRGVVMMSQKWTKR